jgi:hypothetical protein
MKNFEGVDLKRWLVGLCLASLLSCRISSSSGVGHSLFVSMDGYKSRVHFQVSTETGKVVWQGDGKSPDDPAAATTPQMRSA